MNPFRFRRIMALMIPIVLVGCSAPSANNSAGQAPRAAAASAKADAASPVGGGCLKDAPAPPATAHRVLVSRVVDGDTVQLSDGTKVRLIGMNTPETVDPRRPVQEYGKEASAYAHQLLEGKEIRLQPGTTPKDKYGRTLAWLWLPDGTFVNALLVRDGYAQVDTFPDNAENADLLVACQREARAANRGLWALPEYHNGAEAARMDRGGSSHAAANRPGLR